jgi:hypothetical protein
MLEVLTRALEAAADAGLTEPQDIASFVMDWLSEEYFDRG